MIKTMTFFTAIISPLLVGIIILTVGRHPLVGGILTALGIIVPLFGLFVTFYDAKDKKLRYVYNNLKYTEQLKYWLSPKFRKQVKGSLK